MDLGAYYRLHAFLNSSVKTNRTAAKRKNPETLDIQRFPGGAGNVTRTHDLLITNQLLYRLSYTSLLLDSLYIVAQGMSKVKIFPLLFSFFFLPFDQPDLAPRLVLLFVYFCHFLRDCQGAQPCRDLRLLRQNFRSLPRFSIKNANFSSVSICLHKMTPPQYSK